MNHDHTLSLEEAAHFLRLGLDHTRTLFDSGELPGLSLNQKHIVFLQSDLVEFIRKNARLQAEARRSKISKTERQSEAREWGRRKPKPGPRPGGILDLSQYESAARN